MNMLYRIILVLLLTISFCYTSNPFGFDEEITEGCKKVVQDSIKKRFEDKQYVYIEDRENSHERDIFFVEIYPDKYCMIRYDCAERKGRLFEDFHFESSEFNTKIQEIVDKIKKVSKERGVNVYFSCYKIFEKMNVYSLNVDENKEYRVEFEDRLGEESTVRFFPNRPFESGCLRRGSNTYYSKTVKMAKDNHEVYLHLNYEHFESVKDSISRFIDSSIEENVDIVEKETDTKQSKYITLVMSVLCAYSDFSLTDFKDEIRKEGFNLLRDSLFCVFKNIKFNQVLNKIDFNDLKKVERVCYPLAKQSEIDEKDEIGNPTDKERLCNLIVKLVEDMHPLDILNSNEKCEFIFEIFSLTKNYFEEFYKIFDLEDIQDSSVSDKYDKEFLRIKDMAVDFWIDEMSTYCDNLARSDEVWLDSGFFDDCSELIDVSPESKCDVPSYIFSLTGVLQVGNAEE